MLINSIYHSFIQLSIKHIRINTNNQPNVPSFRSNKLNGEFDFKSRGYRNEKNYRHYVVNVKYLKTKFLNFNNNKQ